MANPKGTPEGLTGEQRAEAWWQDVGQFIPHQDYGTRRFDAGYGGCHDAATAAFLAALQTDREKLRRLQAVTRESMKLKTANNAIYRTPLNAALDALLEGDLVDGD